MRELAEPRGDDRMLGGVVEDDEIGPCRDDGLDVGVDPGAEIGDCGGLAGVVAPLRAPHHGAPGADGEEQLGAGGDQRDDAGGGNPDGHGVAGIVHHDDGAGTRTRLAAGQHGERRGAEQEAESGNRATHPSPGGDHGGANGEVSWLRAVARLPGCPVAS